MNAVALIGAALSALNEAMKLIPDYDQRKREKYFKLKSKYEKQLNSTDIDDQLLDDLADELKLFIEAFASEIRGKDV